jgi:hypothetical protein
MKKIYAINTCYSQDRDKAIKILQQSFCSGIFKPIDRWRFKVKADIPYTQAFSILVQNNIAIESIHKNLFF